MGGSSTYQGNGGGTPGISDCGGIFQFLVITREEESLIFSDFIVGQEVMLRLKKERLPRIEVIRIHDDLLIGLVPSGYSKLIGCIENGWEYYGHIIKIEGYEFDPQIHVQVKGEK